MKIIIMGGTFNPIHCGHLFLIQEIHYQYPQFLIQLVPSFLSPHKQNQSISLHDRLNMLELAIKPYPYVHLNLCEVERRGISYSITTIMLIKQIYDLRDKPYLVIGDDLLNSFMTWQHYQKILKEAQLLVAHRCSLDRIKVPFSIHYLNNKILFISSSEIRERVRDKRPIDFLLPDSVAQYIYTHKLYQLYEK